MQEGGAAGAAPGYMAQATWGQWVGHPGSTVPSYSGRDGAFAAAPMAYAQPMYPAAAAAAGSPRYGYQPVSPVFAAQPPSAGAGMPLYGAPHHGSLAPATDYDCEVRCPVSPRLVVSPGKIWNLPRMGHKTFPCPPRPALSGR